jgi:dTDP-4-dehydrorhamnose reductase
MLGRTLQKELSGHEITVADLPEWDITDDIAFSRKLSAAAPDLVVHCAAMTNVDGCESDREKAFLLNETGSRNVALACKMNSARLIAVSTDYVFSGEPPQEPWAWGEGDLPRPRTVYGESKLAGERMVTMLLPEAVVLRIA